LRVEFESGVRNCTISAENGWDSVPIGSNATSYLVATGVVAAFAMLLQEDKSGIHWPDEYGSRWIKFIKTNDLCAIEIDSDADYGFEKELTASKENVMLEESK
jgi:homospermidine synthase